MLTFVTFLSFLDAMFEEEELVLIHQPTRGSLVWQQNRLAEARYKLSPREQKLLLYVVAMIEPEAENFGKCKVSVRDYASLTLLKSKDLYEELRDTAVGIREKTLVVENVIEPGMKKPVRRHGSWFEYVDEAVGDGHVTIKLSGWLKPYLLRVKTEFFRYQLGYALSLKSEYSIRLYQWLKRWQFVRRRITSIADLRLHLGATEIDHEGKIVRENLAMYKHLKNRAIGPAVEEINRKTDIFVTYEEIKAPGSKTVAKIAFTVIENAANKGKLMPVPLPSKAQMELELPPETKPVAQLLGEEFGLSRAQVEWLEVQILERGQDYVIKQAEIVRGAPRRNLAGAFVAAIRDGWQVPKTLQKPAKAEKPEPPGWREWLQKKYPLADIPATFAELRKLFPSVAREVDDADLGQASGTVASRKLTAVN
jgi:plasmid replication initiation protein